MTLLLLLLLAGCGGTTTSPPRAQKPPLAVTPTTTAAPARLTRERCADLVVLGLRGQGQSLRGRDGAGRDVDGVARSMVSQLPRGTTVRIEGVPFPSRSGGEATYTSDVGAAVRLVRDRLAVLADRCPDSHVALAGYSQGAEVVHRSAVALPHPSMVAVVVLMGDPQRDPSDHVRTLLMGVGARTGRGNAGPGARFPDPVRRRVLEVCAQGDDVCNAPPAGRVGPPSIAHHTTYKSRATEHLVAVEAARVAVGAGV